MFASLKGKISEKFRNLSQPADELDKLLGDIVDRATSELLIGPDWGINMELVDAINRNPRVCNDKAMRQMKRTLNKPNAKVQLLTLTLLETCAKNCSRSFHDQLVLSDLWQDLVQIPNDQSIQRVDAEVSDKILCLIEDFARGSSIQGYRDAYEGLLDRGVDFPVRTNEEYLPITTPVRYEPPAHVPVDGQDMTEADRTAIAAALADLEAEERATRAAAAAAAAAAAPHPVADIPPPLPHLAAPVPAQHGAVHTATTTMTGSPQSARTVSPQQQQQQQQQELPSAKDVETLLQVAANSRSLLAEVLSSIPANDTAAVREGYVRELADACTVYMSRLRDLLASLADEVLLVSALGEHEELQKLLGSYDERVMLASSSEPGGRAAPAATAVAPTPAPLHPPDAAAAAAAASAAAYAVDLLYEAGGKPEAVDDEEEEGLRTRRAAVPVAPPPAPQFPIGGPVEVPPAADLIDLDSPAIALDAPASLPRPPSGGLAQVPEGVLEQQVLAPPQGEPTAPVEGSPPGGLPVSTMPVETSSSAAQAAAEGSSPGVASPHASSPRIA